MGCRARDIENSKRNDAEVARHCRCWIALAAMTIVSIVTIMSYGMVNSIYTGTASDQEYYGDDQAEGANDAEGEDGGGEGEGGEGQDGGGGRFLSEDSNDGENNSADNQDGEEDEEDYDYDASSATFNMNINVPKYYMDGTELFFLAFMLVIVLALLPYGYRVLKDRKAVNARFGVGFFSAALIMFANLSFLFSLLLSYSGEVGIVFDLYRWAILRPISLCEFNPLWHQLIDIFSFLRSPHIFDLHRLLKRITETMHHSHSPTLLRHYALSLLFFTSSMAQSSMTPIPSFGQALPTGLSWNRRRVKNPFAVTFQRQRMRGRVFKSSPSSVCLPLLWSSSGAAATLP